MIIFPAIDLKEGNCVRLFKGDMEQATVFSDSPAAQAKRFEDAGFKWLHLVDLDGAFEGKAVNGDSVSAILDNISIPVQLGGGIRTMQHIEHWLEKGVSRVILGTVAAKNPELVIEACSAFPEHIAVGIDARNGMVAVEGWAESSELAALELSKKFEDCGVAAIIYTDINRDGAMQGPNLQETVALAQQISTPVILSGGVTTMQDIHDIANHETDGICGAIVGRALYEGSISYEEALRA